MFQDTCIAKENEINLTFLGNIGIFDTFFINNDFYV